MNDTDSQGGLEGKWEQVTYIDGTGSPYEMQLDFKGASLQYHVNSYNVITVDGTVGYKVWNDSVLQILAPDSNASKVFRNEYQVFRIGPYTDARPGKTYRDALTLVGADLSPDCPAVDSCAGSFPQVLASPYKITVFR